ncbi:MAG: peptidase M28, partial [Pseudomonadota bacterium]|nr:peptidase M28 [Pseudomonadota bacterium]
MILRRSSIIAAAALLLAACATAPDAPVVPPSAATDAFAVASAATPQFSAQRLSDHIKYLADDRLEGRFPGLVGERLTLEYLQAQYEAMGLEPGGRDGSWLQPVDLVRFTPERPPVATWTGADGVSHDLTS